MDPIGKGVAVSIAEKLIQILMKFCGVGIRDHLQAAGLAFGEKGYASSVVVGIFGKISALIFGGIQQPCPFVFLIHSGFCSFSFDAIHFGFVLTKII